MPLVVDASVVGRLFVRNQARAYTDRIRRQARSQRLYVPVVWPLEFSNALWQDVRSFLMDRESLTTHHAFWSDEAPECRCLRELSGLSDEEHALYDDLRENRLGERVRLEQEHIGFPRVKEAVLSAWGP
jgi:hypothetical protein